VRSAAARPKGEKREGRGGPGVGVPRGARELMGSGPDRRVAPAAQTCPATKCCKDVHATMDLWSHKKKSGLKQ
jgi:hypothetical protein